MNPPVSVDDFAPAAVGKAAPLHLFQRLSCVDVHNCRVDQMKRRVISKRNELPPTFDLGKYAKAIEFGLIEWLPLLEARMLRSEMLAQGWSSIDSSELHRAADWLLQEPLWPLAAQIDSAGRPISTAPPSNVTDMSVHDYFTARYCFSDDSKQLSAYVAAAKELDEHGEYSRVRDLLDQPLWSAYLASGLTGEDEYFVRVGLHGSDEKIIDDFAAWLAEMRRKLAMELPKQRVQDTDLANWAKYQLLAYLDLTFWAKVNNCQITNQVLGIVLFPTDYEVALSGRVRKVVMPLARYVCREAFTDMLRSQVSELVGMGARAVPGKWGTVLVDSSGNITLVPGKSDEMGSGT